MANARARDLSALWQQQIKEEQGERGEKMLKSI